MPDILNFKKFAGIFSPAVPAEAALGILTLTRKNPGQPGQAAIDIPSGTEFNTPQAVFASFEDASISQSADFLPLAVRARVPGAAGNIAAGQDWAGPIAAVNITNTAAFAGGSDAIAAVNAGAKSLTNRLNEAEDSVIQDCLNTAVAKIRTMLAIGADDPLPDDKPEIDRACYLLAQFFLENRQTQEKQTSLDLDTIKEQKTSYYRSQVFKAVNRECLNLIAPYRNSLAFMPDAPQTREASA